MEYAVFGNGNASLLSLRPLVGHWCALVMGRQHVLQALCGPIADHCSRAETANALVHPLRAPLLTSDLCA